MSPEERQQLEATLESLRAQLGRAKSLDPNLAARLRETLAEVDAALAAESPAAASPHASEPAGEASLTDRLSEIALEFEASHPTLSGGLGSIVSALGRMGI